jgi:hypothetical protein
MAIHDLEQTTKLAVGYLAEKSAPPPVIRSGPGVVGGAGRALNTRDDDPLHLSLGR